MVQLVFIIFCIIFVFINVTDQLNCGYNENEIECPADCLSEYCPTSESHNGPCPKPQVCGESKCKCNFNNRRAPNGTCIPTTECPPFECSRQNEEYVACPSYCPTDDCSQATPEGICPLFGNILIVVECSPQCRCIKGYWRKNGVCVPYNECPKG